jgi:hypothetical protein
VFSNVRRCFRGLILRCNPEICPEVLRRSTKFRGMADPRQRFKYDPAVWESNAYNYWIFGFGPSSNILKRLENNVSETGSGPVIEVSSF